MGELLSFPRARVDTDRARGCVHCWKTDDGDYEIGHESRSGSSWGSFHRFDRADTAIRAAYDLAHETYGNADVWVHPEVIADVPVTPGPVAGGW